MTIEAIVQLIGAASLALVALRVAVSSFAVVSERIALHRERRRIAAKFDEWLEAEPVHGDRPAAAPAPVLGWRGRRRFRIVGRVAETLDETVSSFYLEPLDRRPIPNFLPGQFLTFEVPDQSAAGKTRRCYSLSSAPAPKGRQSQYRVTIKRLDPPASAPAGTPGGIASQFFHQLGENAVLDVHAPAGEFVLDQDTDAPVVLIAGGVGITPVMSMLEWIVAAQPLRRVWLFYGVRNRSEHVMYDHLKQMAQTHANFQCVTFYSRPSPYCRPGIDYDVQGRISIGYVSALLTGGGYRFYVCGPQAMMEDVLAGLAQWGVPERDISFEAFGVSTAAIAEVSDFAALDGPGDVVASVDFTRSNRRLRWDPGAKNLLELAEQNGINARYGCRSGGCGTCEMRVLSGEVAYNRQPLIKPKPGTCLACIARPTGDIVLDA